MNILYFASIAFYQKPNPSFHLMCTMIEDLLAHGDEIFYVGIKDKKLNKQIPDEFICNPKFHYNLVTCPQVKKNHFILRYLRGFLYALMARPKIKKFAHQSDIIFLQSSPTVVYNVLAVRSVAKYKKVILNIQDMFPGSSIASGVMPKQWMQKIFFKLQKIAYKNVDIIVAISEDMKRKLIEQSVPSEKIRVILNWFDDKSVHEVEWDKNRFVKKYSMRNDKFYLQYAGTIGYVFNYHVILELAKTLSQNKDIEIQIIGEGSCKQAFVDAVKSDGIENITFLPLEPQQMVSDVYSACSICIIPLKKGVIGNSVPSKAGLLMACKRPILTIADKDSYYVKEINENKIGIAFSDDNIESITDAILKLYNDRHLCEEMGRRGYEYGRLLYSREVNMNKYYEVLSK